MKLNGSQIILRVLKEKGVDTLFGYPGGAVIPFFDALYDELDYFHVYRPAHEQNGVHAADGYARSTGKLGVFIATSGPGATNAVTGIATAYMDSVPLLVITGQVPNMLIGKDSFQEIDVTGITLSITKHNFIVRKIEDLQQTVEKAIDIALGGRPGPVVVDIPKDVFLGEYKYQTNHYQAEKKESVIDENDLKKAIELINDAQKPVIYAGGGVRLSKTDDLLVSFAEKANIPVANSFMGLGTIDRNHPLSLGFVGMHGFKETNMAVTNCDLLIAIGARFSDRVIGNPNKFAPNAKIIHIDIDGTEVDKNTTNCIPLLGDFHAILSKLIQSAATDKKEVRAKWLSSIRETAVPKEDTTTFTPENIIEKVNHCYQENTIVVTDVGQHQMWAGQYWKFKKSNEFITSGGLGTMGFGMGAAFGAQTGNPKKNTILITGDGCFRMSSQEMVTFSKYKVPIRIVMFNNHTLGMVRQWQKMFSNKRYCETDIGEDVDYIALAKAYHMKAYRIENLNELEAVLEETKHLKEPLFFECVIDKDCSVFPIVPPGRPIDELLLND